MQRLLIVEDDRRVAQRLAHLLATEDFAVDVVSDGREAVERILDQPPALVLLDMRLPGLDGIGVCQAVRPRFEAPILMLTANDDERREIEALRAGIDDYLTKPVRFHVLLARIQALFRRSSRNAQPDSDGRRALRVQDLVLDPDSRSASRSGSPLLLSDSEFQLLWILARSAGEVVARDALLDALRGVEARGLDRSIDMRISKLRRRLGDTEPPYRYIRTVRSVGYLLLLGSPGDGVEATP